MTHHVAAIEGRFRVYRHIGDRHRLYVGGWFTSRREAARYADSLTLRNPAEDTAAVRDPHARAVDGPVSSAGVPRGRQGQPPG